MALAGWKLLCQLWTFSRADLGLTAVNRIEDFGRLPWLQISILLKFLLSSEFGLSDLSALLWTTGIFNVGARQRVGFLKLVVICLQTSGKMLVSYFSL